MDGIGRTRQPMEVGKALIDPGCAGVLTLGILSQHRAGFPGSSGFIRDRGRRHSASRMGPTRLTVRIFFWRCRETTGDGWKV